MYVSQVRKETFSSQIMNRLDVNRVTTCCPPRDKSHNLRTNSEEKPGNYTISPKATGRVNKANASAPCLPFFPLRVQGQDGEAELSARTVCANSDQVWESHRDLATRQN